MIESQHLKQHENDRHLAHWSQWLLRAKDLSHTIHERRHGEYVALATLEQDEASELEQRDKAHLED